jgi:hypothetical protein
MATVASEITSQMWYDASEGGDEFFLDANDTSQASEAPNNRTSDVEEEEEEEEEEEVGGEESSEDEPEAESIPAVVRSETAVVRRARLPAPNTGEEGSLFAVLKKNVGKVSAFRLRWSYLY